MDSFFLFLPRSYIVSRDAVTIGPKQYVLDFLLLPSFRPNVARPYWTRYFARTAWSTTLDVPDDFYTLELADGMFHHYRPIPPFKLELEACGDWLMWDLLTPANPDADDVKCLRVIAGKDPKDATLGVGIGAHLNYELWVEQLDATAAARSADHTAPPREDNNSRYSASDHNMDSPISRRDMDDFQSAATAKLIQSVGNKIRSEFRYHSFRNQTTDSPRPDRSPRRPNRGNHGGGGAGFLSGANQQQQHSITDYVPGNQQQQQQQQHQNLGNFGNQQNPPSFNNNSNNQPHHRNNSQQLGDSSGQSNQRQNQFNGNF